MYGDWEKESEKGIIPRTLQTIFQLTEIDHEFHYTISISFIQIYMEMVKFKKRFQVKILLFFFISFKI